MQTYGILTRLLEEGNHMHMAVRLSIYFASARLRSGFSSHSCVSMVIDPIL